MQTTTNHSSIGQGAIRCGHCNGCKATSSAKGIYCIDMPGFVGPGQKKKAYIDLKCQHITKNASRQQPVIHFLTKVELQ